MSTARFFQSSGRIRGSISLENVFRLEAPLGSQEPMANESKYEVVPIIVDNNANIASGSPAAVKPK